MAVYPTREGTDKMMSDTRIRHPTFHAGYADSYLTGMECRMTYPTLLALENSSVNVFAVHLWTKITKKWRF